MSCTNCKDPIVNGSGTITISESQQPFCDQCGDDASCVEKMDTECVVYHFRVPTKVNQLTNLGMSNGSTLEAILEAIDDLIGNQFNIPLSTTNSPTITLLASGAGNHTLKADLKLSPDSGNLIQVKANGLFVADARDGKVKINATDAADYLVNQLIGGTDGIVSTSIVPVDGMLQIKPSLNLDCLIDLLRGSQEFEDLICEMVTKCQEKCPPITEITTSSVSA